MSDSFLQASRRSLSKPHLHVHPNICMACSPGLIHTTVSQSATRDRTQQSQPAMTKFLSPQNCTPFFALFCLNQERMFVLPYEDAAISTTCWLMLHSSKKSLFLLLLFVSLYFLMSSALLCFRSSRVVLSLFVLLLLEWALRSEWKHRT